MIDNTVLQELKDFIAVKVADNIKLEKATDNANDPKEYVHPIVVIGYLPPKNFLPEGYDIPAIIIGTDQGEQDDDDAFLSIRITFAVYSMGENVHEGTVVPDMQGYIDLNHLISQTRIALSTAAALEKTEIRKPIKWGMYQEQPWPYWYGWMTFDATLAVLEPIDNKMNGG